MKLQFFLNEKEGLMVVSLKGMIDQTQGDALTVCLREVEARKPGGIVVHFADVIDIPKDGIRALALFLRGVKTKSGHVRLTGLSEKLEKRLLEEGIVSASELRASLPEALLELAPLLRSRGA